MVGQVRDGCGDRGTAFARPINTSAHTLMRGESCIPLLPLVARKSGVEIETVLVMVAGMVSAATVEPGPTIVGGEEDFVSLAAV